MTEKILLDVASLKPWENNHRTWEESDVEAMMQELQEYGELTPLIVDENGIVYGGNLRLHAIKRLEMGKAWCFVMPEGCSEQQKLAYALSDNDHAAGYDIGKRDELIAETQADVSLFNMTQGEMRSLKSVVAEMKKEKPKKPKSETQAETITLNIPEDKYDEVYSQLKHICDSSGMTMEAVVIAICEQYCVQNTL